MSGSISNVTPGVLGSLSEADFPRRRVKKAKAKDLIDRFFGDKSMLEDHVKDVAIRSMQNICLGFSRRMRDFRKNTALLDGGVFDTRSYFDALLEVKDSSEELNKRFNFLLQKGDFYHGRAPARCFSMREAKISDFSCFTGKVIMGYRLNSGVSASEALKTLLLGLTFLGPKEVCIVSYYQAILDVLGEKRFNRIFSNFSVRASDLDSPIYKLLKAASSNKEKIDKAEMVYITNSSSYAIKHPFGYLGKHTLLCMDEAEGEEDIEDAEFLGLGVDPLGATKDDVVEYLIEGFNKPAVWMDMLPAPYDMRSFESAKTKTTTIANQITTSREDFFQEEGGRLIRAMSLEFSRIFSLVRASSDEEAAQMFNQMSSITKNEPFDNTITSL